MQIAIVGTGYVGLVTGTCFANLGHSVLCADVDSAKIDGLRSGRMPIYEPGLDDLVAKNVKEERLAFTDDVAAAIRPSLVVFIAVGTPSDADGAADLRYVEEVARSIAAVMDEYKVVVNKSTAPVGTIRLVQRTIRENQKRPVPFSMVSNPEFLREGSAVEDFLRPDRVVIGADESQAIAIMKDLYRPLILLETPFIVTTPESAELIKYATNAFLATKISYINEMAELCEKVGADIRDVAKGMGLDHRIGPRFLSAGPGYGGSCFPKDTRALRALGQQKACRLRVVEAVIQANEDQKARMFPKIKAAIGGSFAGKTVAVLGLSFKPNTDDIRESSSIDLIRSIQAEGGRVRAFDPVAMERARPVLKDVFFARNAYDAAAGADGVVLATEWHPFCNLDFEKLKSLLRAPVFIDLRNVYDPAEVRSRGFAYVGVGR